MCAACFAYLSLVHLSYFRSTGVQAYDGTAEFGPSTLQSMTFRANTVDFWQARPPQWLPLHYCAATAGTMFCPLQNPGKTVVLPVLPCMAALTLDSTCVLSCDLLKKVLMMVKISFHPRKLVRWCYGRSLNVLGFRWDGSDFYNYHMSKSATKQPQNNTHYFPASLEKIHRQKKHRVAFFSCFLQRNCSLVSLHKPDV